MSFGKKKGFRNKRGPQKTEMNLQITSMADIFTIILVFILKSFSSGILSVEPTSSLLLPQAKAGDEAVETVKVEVSAEHVLVEGKQVSALRNYQFETNDLDTDGTARSLVNAFKVQRQKGSLGEREPAAEAPKEPEKRVLLLADQKTPYPTLKRVLTSAAVQGYTDFKFVVVQDQ